MRLQLTAVAVAAVAAAATPAHADGTLSMRGVYYKERSTRVMQPMLDGMFEIGARGVLSAHLVVDAVTSASAGSGAANAVAFSKQRYEGGASYQHELDGPAASVLDKLRLRADTKYSNEPDYKALYGGGKVDAELGEKNTTLSLGGGLGKDFISNSQAQGTFQPPYPCLKTHCDLDTKSLFVSASQLVSRDVVVAVNYDVVQLDGFNQNPYRLVLTSDGFIAERHPDHRLRQALAGALRYYVAATETAVIASYRYYRDDWQIRAHTPELRLVQSVGRDIDATFAYRYYHQTAAFFAPANGRYGSSDPQMSPYPTCNGLTADGSACFTDDPKMTAFTGHGLLAKLGVIGETFALTGRWAGARFEGILEYVVQNNRFGNAVVAHVALTLPFEY